MTDEPRVDAFAFDAFTERLMILLDIELPYRPQPDNGLYDDLGLDSFQAFELLIIVESMAGSVVPPSNLPELFTLADAYNYYTYLKSDSPTVK